MRFRESLSGAMWNWEVVSWIRVTGDSSKRTIFGFFSVVSFFSWGRGFCERFFCFLWGC